MRIGQRAIIAIAGLLTSFVAVGTTPGAAQAPPAEPTGSDTITVTQSANGDRIMHLPKRTADASIAAPAPTTSPAARYRFFVTSGTVTCESGYACAAVPYSNGFYIFKFYYYGTYSLSYWYCCGALDNHQTGGAAMRLLDSNRGQLACVRPGLGWIPANWDPVWYIRLTASVC